MGSVMSNCTCEDCGYEEATQDFYYRSGEVYVFCGRCGSGYTHDITNRDDYEEGRDWTPNFETTETHCDGTFSCGGKKANGNPPGAHRIGGIKNEDIPLIIQDVENQKHLYGHAKLTYKRNDEWVVHDLLNDEIKPFGEIYEPQT